MTILLGFIAVIYTLAIKKFDVGAIGPGGSEVGFQHINNWFHEATGINMICYNITKYLGLVAFLFVAYYGIVGLIQLIKNKSIKKVDRRLLLLGGFYILVGITYIFFEKVIINYRPVLLEGDLEASYPSSHTMLAICICLSSIIISKYYTKDKSITKAINGVTMALMLILIIGRTLSGVHWLTDIIGGILISLFLVSIFYNLEKNLPQKKKD